MITNKQREELEKQQYRLVGNHSAVKVCGWTKNHIRGKGICYKYKFYGIRSHQCLQMTTSLFCANRCKICWRGEKAPVAKTWFGEIDSPSMVIDNSIREHKQLIVGFFGSDSSDKNLLGEAQTVKHVALSLTGEPIVYPRINEILEDFHKRKISTFLVTNGQYPEQIRKIKNLTQLYISVDAPNKEMLREIDRPLFPDYYERFLKSLELMQKKKFRTCLRVTLIKNINDKEELLADYKEHIELAMPEFVEVKAYMFLGASREVMQEENMPYHEDVTEFTKKLVEVLPDYELVDEYTPSRVILLARKDYVGKQFIDFQKFFDVVNAGEEISAEDYSVSEMQEN
jgi:tRNA wybutosine-synthesizing protein 1